MRLSALLPILALSTHCTFAYAADWVELTTSKSNIQYVDMDQLHTTPEGLIQIWVKSLIKTPSKTYHGKYPVYAIEKNSVNCAEQTLSDHFQISFYDTFKKEIYTDKIFFPKFSKPAPHSSEAEILKTVCDCVKDDRSHFECHSAERWAALSERLQREAIQSLPKLD
jgi:hypothetical protein